MATEEEKAHEIARLRALITAEYQAIRQDAQGLTGDARHAFVSARMKVIWGYFEELADIVGSHSEAMALVVESFTTPPTFLQIGPVSLNLALIQAVHQFPDHLVQIDTPVGCYQLQGAKARLFLELFKKYAHEGHLLIVES